MNTRMLTRARKLFNVDYLPASTNRYNQRQWVRQIRMLGDNWLLAQYVERKENVR